MFVAGNGVAGGGGGPAVAIGGIPPLHRPVPIPIGAAAAPRGRHAPIGPPNVFLALPAPRARR